MRKPLLITLLLVLALVGWSAVCAEDGFYVIPAMRGEYAPVPKTGETFSMATGDDGYFEKGVAWPIPRFIDNSNGTVTDKLTGLIWMKNANAFGTKNWADALTAANTLKSGDAGTGLSDNSKAGDWRLPNVRELLSLLDFTRSDPALPENHPFTTADPGIWQNGHWTSTTGGYTLPPFYARIVEFFGGSMSSRDKAELRHVWCVRGGK